MKEKKQSKAQLEKRINNAFLMVDKGNEFKSIYFADRGIGIYICKDYISMSSDFHQHLWRKILGYGFNKPCLYLEMLVDTANKYITEITDKNDKDEIYYSFAKLMKLESTTSNEKVLIQMVDRWIYLVNESIYSISNDPIDLASNIIKYISFHARNNALLNSTKEKGATKNELFDLYIQYIADLINGSDVPIEKTDESLIHTEEILSKALNEVREMNKSLGAKCEDFEIIPPQKMDEAEALDELRK